MTAEEILRELIDDFIIGDFIYEVREQERMGWNGPNVKRFAFLMKEAEEVI